MHSQCCLDGSNRGAVLAERILSEYVHKVSENSEIRAGIPLPPGAHQQGNGVNFALFSRHATNVWLEFFDRPEDGTPSRVIELSAARHRTGDMWHVWVRGVRPGQLYAYRVDGPYCPEKGHRFNAKKLVLDPFATAITYLANWDFGPARGYDPSSPRRDLARSALDDAGTMPKCVFIREHFAWEEIAPPRHPWSKTVIYETHVRGFTIHPSSGVTCPGTYLGMVEKIPYLRKLGVTLDRGRIRPTAPAKWQALVPGCGHVMLGTPGSA
ncbi:MAG: hypothetical protein JXA89_15350 [Anaerolineae bacterium]|nr:hypothetical protein [Anaerolineae bacterium]